MDVNHFIGMNNVYFSLLLLIAVRHLINCKVRIFAVNDALQSSTKEAVVVVHICINLV